MKHNFLKLNAKIINASYNSRAYIFTAVMNFLRIIFLLSSIFCAFTLFAFAKYGSSLEATASSVMYYILFSFGIVFSLCFYILCSYKIQREFLRTTVLKTSFKYFDLISIKLQLKIIYLYILKLLINTLYSILYLSPALLSGLSILYFLGKGMNRQIFFASLILFALLLASGLYFAFCSHQKLAFLSQAIATHIKLSPSQIIEAAKDCTKGKCFNIANFKLLFSLRFIMCIFIIPAFFIMPHYYRCISLYAKQALKVTAPKPAEEKPIMIMKIIKVN